MSYFLKIKKLSSRFSRSITLKQEHTIQVNNWWWRQQVLQISLQYIPSSWRDLNVVGIIICALLWCVVPCEIRNLCLCCLCVIHSHVFLSRSFCALLCKCFTFTCLKLIHWVFDLQNIYMHANLKLVLWVLGLQIFYMHANLTSWSFGSLVCKCFTCTILKLVLICALLCNCWHACQS